MMSPRTHVLLLLLASCCAAAAARACDVSRPLIRAQQLSSQVRPPLVLLKPSVLTLRGGSSEFGALSLLPPMVALVASVALKQVIVALLLGVWSGVLLLQRGNAVRALTQTFDTYMVDALAERSHAGVLVFTLLLGGTIGLVQKAGGGLALGALLQRFMSSAHKGLVCAWALSCLIFFDDYSSILIVGNSLRPVMEPLRVAPERFAFIVHVMGVCLASLSPISSWAGLQIGYVADAFKQLGIEGDPFIATMSTIPYRFFPVLLLALVPLLLSTGRDIGPMAAVKRASTQPMKPPSRRPTERRNPQSEQCYEEPPEGAGTLDPKPGTPLRALNALVPFGTIVVVTFAGMLLDGASTLLALPEATRPPLTLVNVLSNRRLFPFVSSHGLLLSDTLLPVLDNFAGCLGASAHARICCLCRSDSINALIWSSAAGWLAALGLVLSQGLLTLGEAMEAWMAGMKDVLEPAFVLLLAWALGEVIGKVKTAEFLASSLQVSLCSLTWSNFFIAAS